MLEKKIEYNDVQTLLPLQNKMYGYVKKIPRNGERPRNGENPKLVDIQNSKIIFEFNNKDPHNGPNMISWSDSELTVYDCFGEGVCFNGKIAKRVGQPFIIQHFNNGNYLVRSIDTKFACYTDSNFNKIWEVPYRINSLEIFYSITEDILVVQNYGDTAKIKLEGIRLSTGQSIWTKDISGTYFRFKGAFENQLVIEYSFKDELRIQLLNFRDGKINLEHSPPWIEFPNSGRKNREPFIHSKLDRKNGLMVNPFADLDLSSGKLKKRNYFQNIPFMTEIIRGKEFIFNERFIFIDSARWHEYSDKGEHIDFPHELLIIDRIRDEMVFKMEIDRNQIGYMELKILNNKLYALDFFKKLHVYDIAEYSN